MLFQTTQAPTPLFSPNEVARIAGITGQTVRYWCDRYGLPHQRIHGYRLIDLAAARQWLRGWRRGGEAARATLRALDLLLAGGHPSTSTFPDSELNEQPIKAKGPLEAGPLKHQTPEIGIQSLVEEGLVCKRFCTRTDEIDRITG